MKRMNITSVSDEKFFRKLLHTYRSQKNKVIIKWSTPFCPPCKASRPKFEELSHKFSEWKFIEINCDDCEQLCCLHGIVQLPSFSFICNGEEQVIKGAHFDKITNLLTKL